METIYLIFSLVIFVLLAITILKSFNRKDDSEVIEVIIRTKKWKKYILLILFILISFMIIVAFINRKFSFQLAFWLLMYFLNMYNLSLRTTLTSKGINRIDIFGKLLMPLLTWENVKSYDIRGNLKLVFNYKHKESILSLYPIDIKHEDLDKIKEIIGRNLKHEIV